MENEFSEIRRFIRNVKIWERGVVTSRDGATFSVTVRGRDASYDEVTYMGDDSRVPNVGDNVLLGFAQKDSQRPFIYGSTSSGGAGGTITDDEVVDDILSWAYYGRTQGRSFANTSSAEDAVSKPFYGPTGHPPPWETIEDWPYDPPGFIIADVQSGDDPGEVRNIPEHVYPDPTGLTYTYNKKTYNTSWHIGFNKGYLKEWDWFKKEQSRDLLITTPYPGYNYVTLITGSRIILHRVGAGLTPAIASVNFTHDVLYLEGQEDLNVEETELPLFEKLLPTNVAFYTSTNWCNSDPEPPAPTYTGPVGSGGVTNPNSIAIHTFGEFEVLEREIIGPSESSIFDYGDYIVVLVQERIRVNFLLPGEYFGLGYGIDPTVTAWTATTSGTVASSSSCSTWPYQAHYRIYRSNDYSVSATPPGFSNVKYFVKLKALVFYIDPTGGVNYDAMTKVGFGDDKDVILDLGFKLPALSGAANDAARIYRRDKNSNGYFEYYLWDALAGSRIYSGTDGGFYMFFTGRELHGVLDGQCAGNYLGYFFRSRDVSGMAGNMVEPGIDGEKWIPRPELFGTIYGVVTLSEKGYFTVKNDTVLYGPDLSNTDGFTPISHYQGGLRVWRVLEDGSVQVAWEKTDYQIETLPAVGSKLGQSSGGSAIQYPPFSYVTYRLKAFKRISLYDPLLVANGRLICRVTEVTFRNVAREQTTNYIYTEWDPVTEQNVQRTSDSRGVFWYNQIMGVKCFLVCFDLFGGQEQWRLRSPYRAKAWTFTRNRLRSTTINYTTTPTTTTHSYYGESKEAISVDFPFGEYAACDGNTLIISARNSHPMGDLVWNIQQEFGINQYDYGVIFNETDVENGQAKYSAWKDNPARSLDAIDLHSGSVIWSQDFSLAPREQTWLPSRRTNWSNQMGQPIIHRGSVYVYMYNRILRYNLSGGGFETEYDATFRFGQYTSDDGFVSNVNGYPPAPGQIKVVNNCILYSHPWKGSDPDVPWNMMIDPTGKYDEGV